nr:hypothetical protein [uncultured Rhodopila sp.]
MSHSTTTLPRDPDGGILLTLIVALLTPLFIEAAGADIAIARTAARETIAAYRVQNHASLILVGRIIAFGLTALGSLSLSMADELTIAMIIRLRSNANALNRSADRCERMLQETRAAGLAPEPGGGFDEVEVRAAVAAAQRRAAEAVRPPPEPRPAPPIADQAPAPKAEPAPMAKAEPAKHDPYPGMWANAMATVAAEELAAAAHLPPEQRRAATTRAALLTGSANRLMAGQTAPHPRPGDPGWMKPPDKR